MGLTRHSEERSVPRIGGAAGGFVFIELVMVLIVLSIITAMVVPLYGASMSEVRARGIRNQLVSTILHIQERAVSESIEYRFCFNTETSEFWAERQAETPPEEIEPRFEPVNEEFARLTRLPLNFVFDKSSRVREDDVSGANYIRCFPTGSCDAVKLTVIDASSKREQFTLETLGAMGQIRTETPR